MGSLMPPYLEAIASNQEAYSRLIWAPSLLESSTSSLEAFPSKNLRQITSAAQQSGLFESKNLWTHPIEPQDQLAFSSAILLPLLIIATTYLHCFVLAQHTGKTSIA